MAIDYEMLLKKYMDVVAMNEGVDFLYPHEWTKEEWEKWQEFHKKHYPDYPFPEWKETY